MVSSSKKSDKTGGLFPTQSVRKEKRKGDSDLFEKMLRRNVDRRSQGNRRKSPPAKREILFSQNGQVKETCGKWLNTACRRPNLVGGDRE